ncbi:MAG: hypothetical protein NC548_24320 [Lachnospiraceae bacterium]|nr:hypothetical protein [Lachnospiraceae bacterium]
MKTNTKIVYLHLNVPINDKTDFFFSSVKAIFDFVPEEAIGIKYKSLTNALRGRDFYKNKHCIVRIDTLHTKKQQPKNRQEQ